MTQKKTTSKKTPAKTSNVKFIKWFWIAFASGFLFLVLLFLLAGFGAFGKMPEFAELENPENNLATEIISADGKTIGTFFNENRTPVSYDELPEHLVKALVATEDERFYSHSGIDARGTIRAVVNLGRKGGASTITQQLSKMLFTGGSKNIVERIAQKMKEWVIATRLERQYTKEEIITMYFNRYDFLYQAVGIGSASRIYFGKEPRDLKIEESATLVAMLKNPILYNPQKERFKKNSLQRRNQVLKQMEKQEFISTKVKDSLQNLPLEINFSPEGHAEGIATYFREYLRDFMEGWIEENPKQNPVTGEKELYNIYRDGLKIHVTIDSRMQKYAEEAVREHLTKLQKEFDRQNKKNTTAPFRDIEKKEREKIIKQGMRRSERYRIMKAAGKSDKVIYASFKKKVKMRIFSWSGAIDTIMTPRDSILYYKSFFQTGMMSMEPQTGHVKAWVGGNNYKYFQYDHVKQGKRQVGSTFKPFVYATAIDQLKLSPCDTLPNVQYTIEAGRFGSTEDWTPKNSGDKYGGYLTLKNALAKSVNTVTARIMGRIGPVPVVRLAKKMGIKSNIPEVPSIALGTVDLSVYEMVGAYSTFANEGIYNQPVMITRIEDKNGTILYQNVPDPRDVISKEAAYVTLNLMEGVTRAGSGVRLRTGKSYREDYKRVVTGYPYEFTNAIAGKTGTTQNQSDGWFMGVVPNLCTGVWVGAEDRATHFSSVTYGQGAAMSLPIWAIYMRKCYNDKTLKISKDDFVRPGNLGIAIDCEKYNENRKENNDNDEEMDEFE
ncbi:transglycosylase domain-containing protein [Aquimarina agarilytica]|uniref:transglycosylase domain-containing protein n=1 Tax=Aquimarina agarilytica TaxID=1087449 RepID=UPI000288BCE2|nr:transglycosylase domain-containing protein [Aquimarina agarilytica]